MGGFDARSKLKIMMKLAFGLDVAEDEIPCRGITDVTSTDFEYANELDGTVKLLKVSERSDDPAGDDDPSATLADAMLKVSGAARACICARASAWRACALRVQYACLPTCRRRSEVV